MKGEVEVTPEKKLAFIFEIAMATGTTDAGEPLSLGVSGAVIHMTLGKVETRRDYTIKLKDLANMVSDVDTKMLEGALATACRSALTDRLRAQSPEVSWKIIDMVHDAASTVAARANNRGLLAQVAFLQDVCGWSKEEIEKAATDELSKGEENEE